MASKRAEVDRVIVPRNPRHAFPREVVFVYRANGTVVTKWEDEARWRTVAITVSPEAWAEMKRELAR